MSPRRGLGPGAGSNELPGIVSSTCSTRWPTELKIRRHHQACRVSVSLRAFCRLFLIAGGPHVSPRIGHGLWRGEPGTLHCGFIVRVDLLGIQLVLLRSVCGRGPDWKTGIGVGGWARLAVSRAGQERDHHCLHQGSHPDAPVHSSSFLCRSSVMDISSG
jgi:hypothetical protein